MGLVPARCPGWLLEGRGNPSPRGMAAQSRRRRRDGQNPAYRPSGILVLLRLGSCLRRRTFSLYRSMDAEAEEIERLGLSPLAIVRRQGPFGGQGAPVR